MMGQNPAFVYLTDMTGYSLEDSPEHLKEDLMEAADSLRAALPEDYRSDFAVYDMGFYTYHPNMVGGIPEVMTKTIDDHVTHSYYLVFGREMDREGNFKKTWVKLKLPKEDFLSCMESSNKAFYAHMAGRFLNSPAIIGTNNSSLYVYEFKNATDYLISILNGYESCCEQEQGLRSINSCSFCPEDIIGFRSLLEENGFIGIEVENMSYTPYYDTIGNIREYAQITLDLDGEFLDVNEDVIGFLSRMDNAMEGVYGSLYYFDPLNPVCKQIMQQVIGEYSLPLALQEGAVSRAVAEDASLVITTIATVDEFGNQMIYVRTEIPIQMTNTGRTIFLQCIDDCGFDMDSVYKHLTNFYSLLGTYETDELVFNPGTLLPEKRKVELVPNIEIYNGKLDLLTIQKGVVVLFGEASKMIDRIQDYSWYRGMSGSWGYSMGGYEASICLITRSSSIGKGQSNPPRRFAVVKNNISNLINDWNALNQDHLAAFFALHETGHNTSYVHVSLQQGYSLEKFCASFMSDELHLRWGYLGKAHGNSGNAHGGQCWEKYHENYFSSLNEFVETTMKHPRYNYLKRLFYLRFIK